jgi:hypothetical protein
VHRTVVGADERGASALGVLIALFGFLLMVGSLVGWFAFPDESQMTTVTEVTRPSPTPTGEPASVVHEESTTTAEPAPAPTVTIVDKTTTTVSTTPATDKTTTTLAPKPTRRSEGIFLAMFGAGFALFLAGAFFDRIQTITGPGGVGIVLKATGKEAAEAIGKLEDAIKKHDGRIEYGSRRLTALSRRVEALEQALPEPADEDRAAINEASEAADEVAIDESLVRSQIAEDLAAAEQARQRLLDSLDML